jgi:phosphoribosylaminoimidazole (AIR) synthetase
VSSWDVPPLFRWLQESGRVPFDDMLRTFNMGIGLIVVTTRDQSEALIDELAARGGKDARVIGEIVAGEPPSVSYV